MKTVVQNDNVIDSISDIKSIPAEIKIEKSERFGPFWIASAIVADKNTAVSEQIIAKRGYGISRCSRSDKFYPSRGQEIAEGRAKKALFLKLYKKNRSIHQIYMG